MNSYIHILNTKLHYYFNFPSYDINIQCRFIFIHTLKKQGTYILDRQVYNNMCTECYSMLFRRHFVFLEHDIFHFIFPKRKMKSKEKSYTYIQDSQLQIKHLIFFFQIDVTHQYQWQAYYYYYYHYMHTVYLHVVISCKRFPPKKFSTTEYMSIFFTHDNQELMLVASV